MLRDGQVVEDLSVPLFRGGVIAGRVVDAHGDPLDGAQVSALRTPRGGRPTMAGTFQTNDLGEFRIPRLPAGRYLLRVRPQMQSAFQDPNASANPDPPLPQPVPTYFPNVAAIAQAQPIVLNRGETVTGIDMMLAEGTPTVVNGLVLNPEGLPIGAGNVMVRAGGTEAVGGFDMTSNASITPTGTFRLMLPPGDYVLEARAMVRQNPNQVFRQEDQLFGSMRLSVGGTPLDTVSIMVGKGATASGRVVFEGTTPPPPPPGGQVRVPLMNPDGPGCQGSAQATIGPDWTFKVEGLSGTCGASPQGMFGRWTLKAAIFKGQNIMEQLVTFDTGQHFDNVQIVVTDRRTQMDLRVTGDDGQTTREYVALVFPTDKAKWNQLQRFVRTYVPPQMNNPPGQLSAGMSGGRGAQPGAVRVGSVPPPERFMGLPVGEYYVIAIDDMDAEDSMDPAILERLISSAIRVPLTDEGPIEVPLRRYTLADLIR
jgi:hypothetical protein